MEAEDRIKHLENLLARKKKGGSRICWIRYNPAADYSFDVEEAEDDITWLLYEVKRLSAENRQYKEFIAALRDQMTEELGGGGNPPKAR